MLSSHSRVRVIVLSLHNLVLCLDSGRSVDLSKEEETAGTTARDDDVAAGKGRVKSPKQQTWKEKREAARQKKNQAKPVPAAAKLDPQEVSVPNPGGSETPQKGEGGQAEQTHEAQIQDDLGLDSPKAEPKEETVASQNP